MRDTLLIARHEFQRMALRKAFIFVTVAIPVALAAVIAFAVFVESAGQSKSPVGYVDQAGVLDPSLLSTLPNAQKRVQIQAFGDLASGQAALRNGQIQALFVLPPGYPATLSTELYYLDKAPSSLAWQHFDNFVRASLVAPYSPAVQKRLLLGPELSIRDTSTGHVFGGNAGSNLILPMVASVVFFLSTAVASGYMIQVVADEKESRTMEVLLTSVTPAQLILGKGLGLLAAAIDQLGFYALTGAILFLVARPMVPQLQSMVIQWSYLALLVLFFFPAFVLVCAVMLAIGAAVTEVQQGQQIAGMLSLLFMLPIILLPLMIQDAGHPLIVFLSFFPTTSFLTISLRWGLGSIPMWQIAISWLVLVASAAGATAAAVRIFRAGMLRYGQPLSLRLTIAAIRGG